MAWLARELNLTRSAVQGWGDQVPAGRVGDVARATGLTPEQIRPDIFKTDRAA